MLFKIIRSNMLLGAGLLLGLGTLSGNPLEESVNILDEWVKTERLISKEAAQWEADKASLESLISVYGQEIETLERIIEDAENDTSAAEARRAELLEQDKAVKDIENEAIVSLVQAERRVKDLEAVLPPPLKDELTPLFNNIPDNPDETKLSIAQRIQPVVAILTQIQKFNQVVTLVEDFREFEAGRTVQTETVYFGLGAAYYVDQGNQHAGIGVPGKDGWEWKEDLSLTSSIRNFVDIYRGAQQARYIELPVEVQ